MYEIIERIQVRVYSLGYTFIENRDEVIFKTSNYDEARNKLLEYTLACNNTNGSSKGAIAPPLYYLNQAS